MRYSVPISFLLFDDLTTECIREKGYLSWNCLGNSLSLELTVRGILSPLNLKHIDSHTVKCRFYSCLCWNVDIPNFVIKYFQVTCASLKVWRWLSHDNCQITTVPRKQSCESYS